MPCSDQSTTCDQPPGWASSRRPPPSTADDRDVEVDAVAARVRERDRRAVGRERARARGSRRDRPRARSSEPPSASIENSAWRSLPPASRAITQRSSLGEASAAVTRSLAERDLLVQAVGRDAPELQQPGDVGQVAELARGQMPGDRGRADLQVALDHEGISPRATRASDEESSPPWPESTSRCACSATRRVTSIGSPRRSASASAMRRSLRCSSILKPSG